MRVVARPDFDGIVCAVLIYEAEKIDSPPLWIEPGQVQKGEADIRPGDIMANLPYDKRCSMWFDHHVSNDLHHDVEGAFRVAPSAAGVVYEYYKTLGKIEKNFDELIRETDIIDSADLTEDQVLYPEKYPYVLLSMTIKNRDASDPPYWDRLVSLLRSKDIYEVMEDIEVGKRCREVVEENRAFVDILKKHTIIRGKISVCDFRSLEETPSGNRFLTYCLFPETMVSVRIRYDHNNRDSVILSIGHSIFNQSCRVNLGKLLSNYGGGGHAGAGGCTLDSESADDIIETILKILETNQEI